MKELCFTGVYARLAWGGLCRRRWLLAGLALLCFLLPLGAGRAAEYLLSQGVDFHGATLAVTAPEGDGTPRLLEGYMGEMEDIKQYCRFLAMEEDAALNALKAGEVTAVLALPEDFIQGVMRGDNPDLRLIVSGDRPLEPLLLLWVGQSASDILSAFQGGVYAVLELYEEDPPPGLTRDQVVLDINLRYIRLALGRGGLFQTEQVSATRALPIPLHYGLALLAYLALSAAPLFAPIYSVSWLSFQRRLRCVGRGTAGGYFGGVLAGGLALFLLLAPGLAGLGRGDILPLLGAALAMALYCSLFCGLCCLLTEGAAGWGTAAFALALAFLALAGGIVPPVLMPAGLQRLIELSPVTWLMELAAWAMGYEVTPATWLCLALSALGMAALSLALYQRRTDRQEVEP